MADDERLTDYLAKYTPEVAARAEAVLEKLRARLPGAVELVYDNYNALVIGFGPTERPSDATLSVAVYPRWVSLCFLRGAALSDPDSVLAGNGNTARHVVLESPDALDTSVLDDLITQAVGQTTAWDRDRPRRVVVRSVSVKQRPRRPAGAA